MTDPALPPIGGAGSSGSDRSAVALSVTIAGLVIWNGVRGVSVPADLHLPANAAIGLLAGGLGLAGGLSLADMGLARERLAAGLAYGGAVFGSVLVGVGGVALLWSSNRYLADGRVRVDTRDMAFEVLVAIPLGTVLLEELAFRGTILGLMRKRWSTGASVIASSVLFGLWHISGVINGSDAASTGSTAAAVAGTVAATTVAGLGFAWLRVRSGSLLAPVLAHLATNSLTFAAAWWTARR